MDNKQSKNKSLDDFWDIKQLIPKKKNPAYTTHINQKSTTPVEIIAPPLSTENNEISGFTVKRYIPPHESGSINKPEDFLWQETYKPEGSLIHSVNVKKYKPSYNYYSGFANDVAKYSDVKGTCCDFLPFFSYVPQYDQMNERQLNYYLWFRECLRCGRAIKADQGYLLLYVFELINEPTSTPSLNLQQLMTVFEEYGNEFPSISARLADWICDYGLVHKLPPPAHRSSAIIKKLRVLKEYFIHLPTDDMERCAKTLLAYCCSYDYRTSKFYSPQSKELFDKYINGAIEVAVRFYSSDGELLSGAQTGDSVVSRDAFAGALCIANERYRIDISFCSFSRSNELRFIIGDVVKYAENKIRAHIGIKSKMTVYSLSVELRTLIDAYFLNNLPSKRQSKASVERQEYDVLYDLPKKQLSLSEAARIEADSWSTTAELIEAFDDGSNIEASEYNAIVDTELKSEDAESCDRAGDGDPFLQYRPFIDAVLCGDMRTLHELAKGLGKMADGIIDEINEIAYETIGDSLIEDDGNGVYKVVEDYCNMF